MTTPETPTPDVQIIESDLQGAVNVKCADGTLKRVPCTIHKIETRHPNGRVDVTLQVPTLACGSK